MIYHPPLHTTRAAVSPLARLSTTSPYRPASTPATPINEPPLLGAFLQILPCRIQSWKPRRCAVLPPLSSVPVPDNETDKETKLLWSAWTKRVFVHLVIDYLGFHALSRRCRRFYFFGFTMIRAGFVFTTSASAQSSAESHARCMEKCGSPTCLHPFGGRLSNSRFSAYTTSP